MNSAVIDTLSRKVPPPEMIEFVGKIYKLRQAAQASIEAIEMFKKIMAYNWVIANVCILGLFLIGLKIHFFNMKAINVLNKRADVKYELPKRWLYVLIGGYVFAFFIINILPKVIL